VQVLRQDLQLLFVLGNAHHPLEQEAGISESSATSSPDGLRQSTISDTNTPTIPHELTDKFNSAISQYIAESCLGHQHVESSALKTLAAKLIPGYQLPSPRTVKWRILEMYVVLKLLVVAYFVSFSSRVSLTYDGWSSPSVKGFYSVTVHWMDRAKFRISSTTLDFFYAPPE
jgi:hypothetical protein